MRRTVLLSAVLLVAPACGMGPFAGEGGGAAHLPISGTGPYTVLPADFDTPADEPYLLAQPVVSLLDPSVQERDDGGYDIYYTKHDETRSEIWRAMVPSLHELPVGSPTQVLVASSPWEEGRVSGASLVRSGADLILYYDGGIDAVSVGRAVSTDGGQSFVKDANNPIVSSALDPHVTLFQDRWFMVHIDAEEDRIFLRESEDGIDFSEAREILKTRSGIDTAFDQLALRGPALHLRATLDGGLHYGLFYTGLGFRSTDDVIESIGYLGSFDSVNWQRFMDGEPIMQPGPSGAGGASPIVGGTESLLFFHQLRQARGRIAVAISGE